MQNRENKDWVGEILDLDKHELYSTQDKTFKKKKASLGSKSSGKPGSKSSGKPGAWRS